MEITRFMNPNRKNVETNSVLAKHEKLTDDEFVACYVDGMSRMVGQIYENAGETLRADAKCYARFCDAIEHPSDMDFVFKIKI